MLNPRSLLLLGYTLSLLSTALGQSGKVKTVRYLQQVEPNEKSKDEEVGCYYRIHDLTSSNHGRWGIYLPVKRQRTAKITLAIRHPTGNNEEPCVPLPTCFHNLLTPSGLCYTLEHIFKKHAQKMPGCSEGSDLALQLVKDLREAYGRRKPEGSVWAVNWKAITNHVVNPDCPDFTSSVVILGPGPGPSNDVFDIGIQHEKLEACPSNVYPVPIGDLYYSTTRIHWKHLYELANIKPPLGHKQIIKIREALEITKDLRLAHVGGYWCLDEYRHDEYATVVMLGKGTSPGLYDLGQEHKTMPKDINALWVHSLNLFFSKVPDIPGDRLTPKNQDSLARATVDELKRSLDKGCPEDMLTLGSGMVPGDKYEQMLGSSLYFCPT